jgi:hypothetical protein
MIELNVCRLYEAGQLEYCRRVLQMKTNKNRMFAAVCAAVLTFGCAQQKKQEKPAEETVTIQVNTEGSGQIAVSDNGEVPAFAPEPIQSHVSNVAPGTELILAAQPEDDYLFAKWTKDGEDYSREDTIEITADADTEYIAVFMLSTGWQGEAVSDIKDAETIGDVLALGSRGEAYGDDYYLYAFELNGTVYQTIAELTPELSGSLFELDFSDPEYERKKNEIVAPLEIKEIINVSEKIPSESDTQKYAGKTFGELTDEGFWISGWNTLDNTAVLGNQYFSYEASFEGKFDESFDEEDLLPLTVKSIRCTGIGDASWHE